MRRIALGLVAVLLVAGLTVSPAVGAAQALDRPTANHAQLNDDYLEPNDELWSSTEVSPGTYAGLTITADDRDYFQMDLQQGEEVTFTAEFTHADGDLDMLVTDPQNDTVERSISVTDDETISFTAQDTGRYDVIVYGYDGATNEYDLDVSTGSGLSADRFEPNDDLWSSTEVSPGSYDDLTITSDDRDYFQIDLQQGDEATFTAEFAHADGDLDMLVTDPQNDTVERSISVTDDETISFTAQDTGRYDVIVYGYDGATNDYDLEVATDGSGSLSADRFEPNDDLWSSTEVSPGSYDDLTITSDDRDYFQIDLQQGDEMTVTAEFTHADGDLDMLVTDPLNDTVERSISVSDDETISFTAQQSGRYDVIVYGYDGAANEYDLDVATDGSGVLTQDRFEPNDELGSSTEVSPGSYDDLTITSDDRDYFQMDLQQGEDVSFTAEFAHADGDLDMLVTDPLNDTVERSISVSDDETISFTAQDTGRYDVIVYGYDGATNEYDFEVSG